METEERSNESQVDIKKSSNEKNKGDEGSRRLFLQA